MVQQKRKSEADLQETKASRGSVGNQWCPAAVAIARMAAVKERCRREGCLVRPWRSMASGILRNIIISAKNTKKTTLTTDSVDVIRIKTMYGGGSPGKGRRDTTRGSAVRPGREEETRQEGWRSAREGHNHKVHPPPFFLVLYL